VLAVVVGALLTVSAALAETGYVSERLSVPLNPAPDDIGPALKRLEAGSAIEVLARSERYVRVRDKQGAEGWIDARFVTSEAPARLQVGKLQDDLGKARKDLADAQARAKQLETALEQEASKSKELAKNLAEAKAAPPPAPVVQAPAPPPPVVPPPTNASADTELRFSAGWLLISFAMLGIGFVSGVRWLKHSIRRRSGGMYLRV
jgi:uncharacterized protein YgiM (DUF1202 family)